MPVHIGINVNTRVPILYPDAYSDGSSSLL
jgi:hypothetical protein